MEAKAQSNSVKSKKEQFEMINEISNGLEPDIKSEKRACEILMQLCRHFRFDDAQCSVQDKDPTKSET